MSGGQRQRITIARVLLMNPRILILDDSTSSVNVDTEHEIQQALSALLKSKTTFVITQRISTIRNADKIIVLNNGEIGGRNHESLMKRGDSNSRLYQMRFKDIEPADRLLIEKKTQSIQESK